MKVAFYNLGCKVNSYELMAIEFMFKNDGYDIVDFNDESDIYVINTCSVTNQSDVKSRKAIRSCKRKNPNAIVAVMGCFSQLNSEKCAEIGADVILGTSNRSKLKELVEKVLKEKHKEILITKSKDIKEYEKLEATEFEHTRAFLKIQDGCNNFCSYCIIPYARGRMRSKDPLDVINESKIIVNKGYKEIVLAGIHTGGYGTDINYPFSKLVKNILDEVKGLERLRISSIEINQIDDELLMLIKNNKVMCHHLHLPVQSCSNHVLRDMNRHYTIEEYIDKINYIRSIIPDISITTDIIIGYPIESDEDFSETLKNVAKIRFSFMHIFPFSKRSGTKCDKYNEINGIIMKSRFNKLNELNLVLAKEYANLFLDKTLDFIPEEYIDGYLYGHTNNYLRVRVEGKKEYIGNMYSILIKKADFPICDGKII
ncbi:MAG: tRNA (N(6)-L-threonylcarbamoyladenosine(37)-C(2))-methylthiotransferase MtaB [bacterium]|nr:tRNA (N(6)-L-threonylcarbamoyladenosine(37)-C(2))-methylthiotransferase MtaB [bacterium]